MMNDNILMIYRKVSQWRSHSINICAGWNLRYCISHGIWYEFQPVLFPFYWSVYFQWNDTYNIMNKVFSLYINKRSVCSFRRSSHIWRKAQLYKEKKCIQFNSRWEPKPIQRIAYKFAIGHIYVDLNHSPTHDLINVEASTCCFNSICSCKKIYEENLKSGSRDLLLLRQTFVSQVLMLQSQFPTGVWRGWVQSFMGVSEVLQNQIVLDSVVWSHFVDTFSFVVCIQLNILFE